jgi:O-antigen/teichoic acid export membrane protein
MNYFGGRLGATQLHGAEVITDTSTGHLSRWRARLPSHLERAPGLGHSGLARDHIMTFGTEFGVMGASLIMLKLAAAYAGTSGFGEFVLGRRVIGFIQLPALCGIGLALTRSVAIARASGRQLAEWKYLDAAVLITCCTGALAVAMLVFERAPIAKVALGGAAMAPLALALAPGVAGLILHGVAYGMLRGRQTMVPANVLQGINLGFVPLGVFIFPGLSVPQLLCGIGVAQLAVAVIALLAIRTQGPRVATWDETWGESGRELLRYGAPRIPGEFALGAMNALPVMAAAYYGGAVAAGQVGLGLSLLSLLSSVFAPLGQVLLPSISGRAAAGEVKGLGRGIWQLTAVCMALTAVGVLLLEVLASWLLPLVFGAGFAAAVLPVRIIVLGAMPYVAYVVLRNVLDALDTAPLNAANLFAALGAFGIVLGIGRSIGAVPLAVLASEVVLGGLTAWRARRALKALAGRSR